MNKDYRPDGFENPYKIPLGSAATKVEMFAEDLPLAFEAGASAMLEGLTAEGVFTYGLHTPDIDLEDAREVSGYWVFIPEGE